MDAEELNQTIAAVEVKEAQDGLELTEKDINMLRKLWMGEITIEEYMAY